MLYVTLLTYQTLPYTHELESQIKEKTLDGKA